MLYREFDFVVAGQEFVSLLQQMLDYIEQDMTVQVLDKEQLLFESKIILTELLTNAIKHSGTGSTRFMIRSDEDTIEFVKKDDGKPLALVQHPQLQQRGDSVLLVKDIMHSLHATVQEDLTIHFSCVELDAPSFLNIEEVNEHFGLLIMTKAADSCQYQYDQLQGINTFKVSKRLQLSL